MAQEVEVTRTLLPAPTPDDPERRIYQIQYRVGMLPPHFVYIPEKEWTEKKEKEAIQADIKKMMETKRTIIKI